MESGSQTWLIMRISLVVLSGPAWLMIRAQMQGDFATPPSWYFPLILIGFSLFGVILLSVLRSDKEWIAPNWRDNPIDAGKPLQGIHLAAWSFIAGAFALLMLGLLQSPIDWAWVLPGCLGVGLLAGIRLVSIPEHRHGT